MSVLSRPTVPATAATPTSWREWNLVALAILIAYSTAIGWQAQVVSYPLYRVVGTDEFAAYHAAYNESIPLVVIAPGFATFLGAIAFYWTRPAGVSRRRAAVVAGTGLVSLLSTVLWAIPRHDDLDRIGRSHDTIDSLLQANGIRVAALTVGTIVITSCVARLLRRNG